MTKRDRSLRLITVHNVRITIDRLWEVTAEEKKKESGKRKFEEIDSDDIDDDPLPKQKRRKAYPMIYYIKYLFYFVIL